MELSPSGEKATKLNDQSVHTRFERISNLLNRRVKNPRSGRHHRAQTVRTFVAQSGGNFSANQTINLNSLDFSSDYNDIRTQNTTFDRTVLNTNEQEKEINIEKKLVCMPLLLNQSAALQRPST